MSFIFQIVETEKQPALVVKKTISVREMPQVVGEAYRMIVNYIISMGEEPLGPAFIAYYNMDMEHLEVEIGFPTLKVIQGSGGIVSTMLPAGKKAVGYHKGAYGEIAPVYDKLAAWAVEKGHMPSGIAYEHYFNSPGEIPESELLTRVEFLLK